MARAVGWKSKFNSGELGEDAWTASDLQQHAAGCALGLNYVGRVSGALGRRPAFWWNGAPKHHDKAARMIEFRRSIEDPLMLEFGDLYVRVWQADGTPLMSGPSQVEFVSPYAEADLPKLRPLQAGDVVTIRHADGSRPKQLVRTSNTSWAFSDYTPKNGPFRPENKVESFTVTVTATSGTTHTDVGVTSSGVIMPGAVVSLVAAAPLFDAGQIGGLFGFRDNTGNPGVQSWAPDASFTGGQFLLSDGKVYKIAGGGTPNSGLTPPVHDVGTASDGRVDLDYLHDGRGVVKITAVADSTHATATVITAVPVKSGSATAFWSEGAYSDYRGWPTAWPAIREERLVEGATRAEPDKFDASRTAGYDATGGDFKPGLGTGRVVDDDAVRRFAGDQSARIVWFVSTTFLLAGTAAEELVITGATLEDPIAPTGTVARSLSDFGSADVQPVKAHKAVLFVARGGKTLCSLYVAPDLSSATEDLSFFADHIAERGFAQVVWTGAPDYLAWARLEDGGLVALVYNPQQKVFGWYSQELGGGFLAESLAVLPGAFGRDALWILARREVGEETQRAILMLSAPAEKMRLDAAARYFGEPATGVEGLDHLEGDSVIAMAGPGDGTFAEYRGLTVTDGAVTLPGGASAAEIVVGLNYLSRFESLPTDLEGPGSTQGKRQRVTQMLVTMTGVRARAGVSTAERLETVARRDLSETATLTEKRFVERIGCEGDTSRDPRLVVEADGGFDLVIHALRPEMVVNA